MVRPVATGAGRASTRSSDAPLQLASLPASSASTDYLGELISRAETLGLAESPRWHALLHYRDRRFGRGVVSATASDAFFLSPDGRTDPHAELVATLAAFLGDGPDAADHPQCAFPARFHWLGQELGFDDRMPRRRCERFEAWRSALDPASLTLVFPEAYMNNPASMFGHTLLRIDMQGEAGEHDLLAYAINFAADTGPDGGAAFALKGIFGLYDGYFSILPYYEKVSQYGDWENRDIWEYALTFDRDEIDFILMHLWELRGIAFTYYFFDDNCSYQLLSLLEVARPELRLTEGYGPWVIPVDTVRALADVPGLVADVEFRVSPATHLRSASRVIDEPLLPVVDQLVAGEIEPSDPAVAELPDHERAQALELAHDVVRYRFVTGDLDRDTAEPRARSMLIARSRVGVTGDQFPAITPPATRPDQGHGTARLAVGGGWQDDRSFVELRLRPSFHELMDPAGGYTSGAEIVMLDVAARYYPEQDKVRLHELVLADIVSLSPRTTFLKPISWKLNTGLRTRLVQHGANTDVDRESVWRSEGGAGLAFALGTNALAYGLAEATLDLGAGLHRDVALGPGASAGIYLGPTSDRWRTHLFAQMKGFVLGDTTTTVRTGIEQRLTLTRNTALVLDVAYERSHGEGWLDARLLWKFYFGTRRDPR